MVRTICPSRPMRMKALGAKPSASAAAASRVRDGRLRLEHQAAARGRAGLQKARAGTDRSLSDAIASDGR